MLVLKHHLENLSWKGSGHAWKCWLLRYLCCSILLTFELSNFKTIIWGCIYACAVTGDFLSLGSWSLKNWLGWVTSHSLLPIAFIICFSSNDDLYWSLLLLLFFACVLTGACSLTWDACQFVALFNSDRQCEGPCMEMVFLMVLSKRIIIL